MNDNQAPVKKESFIISQLKLASSTIVVTSIGSIVLMFWLALGSFISFIFLIIFIASIASTADPTLNPNIEYGDYGSNNQFLAINVHGPIEGTNSSSGYIDQIFGGELNTYGYDIKKQLLSEADIDTYKGIILMIDSPGGTIYGSKAISDGVNYYKDKTKKPVYAYIEGMAASGAYWAASSADKIFADAGTGIGSIGVIYGPFTYYDKPIAVDGGILGGGVITQNGIEQTYISAGSGKDAGNPFRRLTAEETKIIQESVNNNYNDFLNQIALTRSIPKTYLKDTVGAHLYGEQQAISNRLIDGTLPKEDAYIELAKAAGINDSNFNIVNQPYISNSTPSLFGIKLPFNINKPAVSKCSDKAISMPLAYHGDVSLNTCFSSDN